MRLQPIKSGMNDSWLLLRQSFHQQYDAKPGNRDYCGLRPLGVQLDVNDIETKKIDA